MNKILYIIKDNAPSDIVFSYNRAGYINEPYFHRACDGNLIITGPSYSTFGNDVLPPYEYVDTYLTQPQYESLMVAKEEMAFKDDDEDMRWLAEIMWSDEYYRFENLVKEHEIRYIAQAHGISRADAEAISRGMDYNYIDESAVCYIWNNYSDIAESFIEDCVDMPSYAKDYFDYERFGRDWVNQSSEYYELPSGKIVQYYI